MTFHVPNKYRIRTGRMGTDDSAGNCGAFFVPVRSLIRAPLRCVASFQEGWEHVSVSTPARCPTWPEMHLIKTLFWDDDDTVMQLHPPASEYVNNHPFCLHLWSPTNGQQIPLPPSIFVGLKEINPEQTKALIQAGVL